MLVNIYLMFFQIFILIILKINLNFKMKFLLIFFILFPYSLYALDINQSVKSTIENNPKVKINILTLGFKS